jgi:hypothetical protein
MSFKRCPSSKEKVRCVNRGGVSFSCSYVSPFGSTWFIIAKLKFEFPKINSSPTITVLVLYVGMDGLAQLRWLGWNKVTHAAKDP